jgi:hypothetical protein
MAAGQWKTLGGCPETKGGGDAGTCAGRQEEAPPEPRGTGADHCGDEEAVGGAEEGSLKELDATVLQTKGGPKRNLPISR